MNRYTLPTLGIACLLSGLAVAQAQRPASTASRAPATASATGFADTATRPGDPVQGQAKADAERCIECHGALGQGAGHASGAEGQFPRLAGQHPRYLLKQLADFRSGRRPHDVMAIMASSVDVDDLRDIVAFFASRPRQGGDGSGGRPQAQSLFLYGDAARGLAACAACHGSTALGNAGSQAEAAVPALAGQEYFYLERQLLAWRSGWRSNGPTGAMNQVAKLLTDEEIRQLAAYLSGLP